MPMRTCRTCSRRAAPTPSWSWRTTSTGPDRARAGGVAPIDSAFMLDARASDGGVPASRSPPSKIIWGVPYYGRSWTTTTSDRNGRTCSNSGTCTGGQLGVDLRGCAERRSRQTGGAGTTPGQVPWYRYQSSTYGTWVQGYYDDAASLTVKYDFVKAQPDPRHRHLASVDGRVTSRAVEHDRGGVRRRHSPTSPARRGRRASPGSTNTGSWAAAAPRSSAPPPT